MKEVFFHQKLGDNFLGMALGFVKIKPLQKKKENTYLGADELFSIMHGDALEH